MKKEGSTCASEAINQPGLSLGDDADACLQVGHIDAWSVQRALSLRLIQGTQEGHLSIGHEAPAQDAGLSDDDGARLWVRQGDRLGMLRSCCNVWEVCQAHDRHEGLELPRLILQDPPATLIPTARMSADGMAQSLVVGPAWPFT